jgi:hypothetical protein
MGCQWIRGRRCEMRAMVNLRQKGKIPRNEWPRIMSKYAAGESIAQIGRDYGCTAPAIRYIVKRVEMLKGDGEGPLPEGKNSPSSTSRSPATRSVARDRQKIRPGSAAPSYFATAAQSGTSGGLLGPELRARVTGDVVSVLAALDRAVLEGSIDSLTTLQEAVDSLMRSAARTCIDLGRILNSDARAEFGQSSHARENRRRRA